MPRASQGPNHRAQGANSGPQQYDMLTDRTLNPSLEMTVLNARVRNISTVRPYRRDMCQTMMRVIAVMTTRG
jgi:hypothetical protein